MAGSTATVRRRVSRRAQIAMGEEEVAAFLAQERTVTCATRGVRGWPHLMPLWYVLRDAGTGESSPPAPSSPPGESNPGGLDSPPRESNPGGLDSPPRESNPPIPRIWAWTYAASQKVRNLERDARATLQVESGEQYQELRGVMFECDVAIHRDVSVVAALGNEIFRRYAAPRGEPPVKELPGEVAAMVEKQAAKRVALEFVERRRTSWDHRKLAGVY